MAEEASGKAIASLVCAILSYVFCPVILAIVAIMLASGDNSGMAKAGRILGWINIVLTIVSVIFVVLFAGALGLAGAAASNG